MKKYVFLFILIFISCQDKEENENNRLQQNQLKCIEKAEKFYKINYIIDKLDKKEFYYTIDFKPIINSRYQIIKDFELSDIFEKDSMYYVSLNTGRKRYFHFDFELSYQQLMLLKDTDRYKPNCILIVDITEILKMKFSVISEIREITEISEMADINGLSISKSHLGSSVDYIGKGKIEKIIFY